MHFRTYVPQDYVRQDGGQAVGKAPELMPDLILMDIRMPKLDGLEATRRIKAAHPHLKIVVLTEVEDARTLSEALTVGTEGYLPKDVNPDEFLARVCGIVGGRRPSRGS
ncbi:MAG TPA: response regulator transcription factor [Candidatus Methylomirabilis sp.]|nr:response regulator transcription factor [Candidatus Methylomirabilis sp.]